MKDAKNKQSVEGTTTHEQRNREGRNEWCNIMESNRQLINIINFLPDATFAINLAGGVIAWNKAIEEMTGVPTEDILGKKEYSTLFYAVERPMLIDLAINPDEAIESQYSNFKRKDGTLQAELCVKVAYGIGMAYLWGQATVLYNNEGNVIGAMESFRDLTPKKKYELTMRGSERWFADIINFLPDAMFAIDKKGRVIAWNQAMEKMTGVRANEIVGKGDQEYSIPFYGKRRHMLIDLVFNTDPVLEGMYPKLTKDNMIFIAEGEANVKYGKQRAYLWGQASPLYNEKGCIVGAIESLRDITENKELEYSLRESERRLSDIIDFLPDATLVIDIEGRVIAWNKAAEDMTGINARDILGKGNNEYAIPFYGYKRPILIDLVLEPKELLEKTYPNLERKGKIIIGENFCPSVGESGAYIRATAAPLFDSNGSIVGAIESLRDATEKIKTEEDLLRIKKAVESASNAIWLTDEKGINVIYHNSAFEKLFNYTGEEINRAGGAPVIFISRENARVIFDTLRKGYAWSNEIEMRTRDGRIIPVSSLGDAVKDDAGKTIGYLGIATDISEQKRTKGELVESRQRMADIIEFLPDATIVIDRESRVISWNKAAEEMTGISADDMIGKGGYEYAIPFYGEKKPILIDLVLKSDDELERNYPYLERKGKVLIGENHCPAVKGKGAYLRATASPLYDSSGSIVGAIESIRDATNQKKTEEQMKYMGLHDALTGLYNRAYFDEEMHRLRHSRAVSSIGVVMLDIDGLKMINESFGHEAGDKLLKDTANLIKSCFRQGDVVARVGGDEFTAVLSNIEEQALERAIKRVRKKVEEFNYQDPAFPLSVSIGVAVGDEEKTDVYELFKEADNNMYREKLRRKQSNRSAIVQTLMKALETRDFITKGHAERLQTLAVALARTIGISEQRINDLILLAQFHDIGKVGVADKILFKQGLLTQKERLEMQKHCEMGYHIALAAPDLAPIADWILKHQEWWNGGGYPLGLKGEEIPLECRIISIVDAYDAMTSDRPYRKAMSHEDAVDELKRFAGTQFDPALVNKFVELFKKNSDDKIL